MYILSPSIVLISLPFSHFGMDLVWWNSSGIWETRFLTRLTNYQTPSTVDNSQIRITEKEGRGGGR